jgi:hypothetical protein
MLGVHVLVLLLVLGERELERLYHGCILLHITFAPLDHPRATGQHACIVAALTREQRRQTISLP